MRNCAPVYSFNIIGIRDKGKREYNAAVNALTDYRKIAVAISPTAVVYARLGIGGKEIKDYILQGIRQLQHFPQGLYYNIDHWCQYSRCFDRDRNFISAQRDYIYDEQCRYQGIKTEEGDLQSFLLVHLRSVDLKHLQSL